MSQLLSDAAAEQRDAHRRAVAHELSAESHRAKGVWLGLSATILSAIVGTAIFAIVAARLGLDGKGTLSVPREFWSRVAFYGVIVLSILAPVLSAAQLFLNEPSQVAAHTKSKAKYYKRKKQLDKFLRTYVDTELSGAEMERANRELGEILKLDDDEEDDDISLTPQAYEAADRQLALSKSATNPQLPQRNRA